MTTKKADLPESGGGDGEEDGIEPENFSPVASSGTSRKELSVS